MKMTKSFLANEEEFFTPLPKEQQITEEGLISLERKIAKSNKKNEEFYNKSIIYAEHAMPCANVRSIIPKERANEEIQKVNSEAIVLKKNR